MGYNLRNLGNILPCRIEDGYLIFRYPTGKEMRYSTNWPENVPEQRNIFTGETIAFYLKLSDGRDMIGRFDKSISVYKGRLLFGLNNWQAPITPNVVKCGVVRSDTGKIDTVYKCVDDNQTLMSDGDRQMAVLPNPDINIYYPVDEARTLLCSDIKTKNCIGSNVMPLHWTRFYEGGDGNVRRFT